VIQAIIFDCFGVIRVDPTILAYRHVGGDVEKDHEFIEQVLYASSTGKVSSVELFSKHLGLDAEAWLGILQATSSLDSDILAFINTLRPHYAVALLSNIGKGGLERWFEPGMLEQYFDVAVASGDIGYAKPEPQAYEIIAGRLGVRTEDCIMIDDRPDYCAGARAVGMQTIVYSSLPQLQRELATLGVPAPKA
jgi:HAD superfamily hydrolase (TIGR01509 family)